MPARPARARQTPAAPTQLLDFLRGKVTDGRLPPWTEWWEEDVSPLFPDAATRAAVSAEEPRLPFAYYEQSVPVPTGWDDDVPAASCSSVRHTKKWRPTLAADVGSSRSWPGSTFTSSSTQRPPLTGHSGDDALTRSRALSAPSSRVTTLPRPPTSRHPIHKPGLAAAATCPCTSSSLRTIDR
jgi:hypothetical protein